MLMNLMKYELLRKRNMLAVFFSILVIGELLCIYLLYKGDDALIMFILVLVFMTVGSAIFVLYDNIKLLSDDLNNTQGYMLFMTPNSGYLITASKMIIGLIEITVTAMVLVMIYYINFRVGNHLYNITSQPEVKEAIYQVDKLFDLLRINGFHYVYMIASWVLDWFAFIAVIYVAIILRKTLFSRAKYGGFITFGIYILINMAMGMVTQGVVTLYTTIYYKGDVMTKMIDPSKNFDEFFGFVMGSIHLGNFLNLVSVVVLFYLCGYLLTKKVDL